MSWSWRTKPRSISKTIEWFPYFAALEGQNWEEKSSAVSRKDQKSVHPVRRAYIYAAHGEEDSRLSDISYEEYLLGQRDQKETESNGRNDKTTFEFFCFGYIKENGTICVTEAGNKIVNGTFDQEDYLKQLLKMRVPNYTYESRKMKRGRFLFPFELVLRVFEQFESLNRSELALLFGCTDRSEMSSAVEAIADFKEQYAALEKKNSSRAVFAIFERIFEKYYGEQPNKTSSYYDYAEAFSRTLIYTGLFSVSGRSIAAKIRIAEHSKLKVQMLREQFCFCFPETIDSLETYMEWYGSVHNVQLPWENANERRSIVEEKLRLLKKKQEEAKKQYLSMEGIVPEQILQQIQKEEETDNGRDINELKQLEKMVSDALTGYNERLFVAVGAKTAQTRKEILNKFEEILANEDMSALWLEVNTWKSLLAIPGEQVIKRNFQIEEDLTPKSFAPGIGNTPDMELYTSRYAIIPEVSLMTGVRQWEHEASSVIDHVLKIVRQQEKKTVLGLFLSSKIHVRTMWQFFLLNRESWLGVPVPVVPLTIRQYMEVLQHMYENGLEMDDLKLLLDYIAKSAVQCENFQIWEQYIGESIRIWKEKKIVRML